jgi:hypothetical protein
MPSSIRSVLISFCLLAGLAWSSAADEPDPKAQLVAWGKPQAGLQAGLRSREGRHVAVGGVPLEFDVVVRNVARQPIEVSYVVPDSYGYAVEGTTVTGAPVSQQMIHKTFTLEPRGLLVLGTIHIGHHRAKRNSLVDERPLWTDLGEGQFQVGCDNVLGGDGQRVPKLASGYVDVDVRAN